MRILLVDDSPSFHQLAEVIVHSRFSEVALDTAEGSETAERLLRKHSYQLMIVDAGHLDSTKADILEHINSNYPEVPVLITSYEGLEKIVKEAIQRGAIGYVSKDHLHDDLPERIRMILNATPRNEPSSLSSQLLKEQTSRFSIPNDRTLVIKVNNYVAQLLQIFNLCSQRDQMRTLLAIEEAMTNAIIHGNLEVSSELRDRDDQAFVKLLNERRGAPGYCERRVEINITVTNALARITIRDEGPGFDVAALPDPRAEENLELVHGRGVFLMRSFMDEVHFNASGNEVTLVKYKSSTEPAPSDSAIWTHVSDPAILRLRAEYKHK